MSAQLQSAAPVSMRWSSVRSCPRKAVYEATGAPHRERSRTEEGWLWRGKQLGRDFAIVLAAEEQRKGNPYLIFVASGDPDEWPARWTTRDRGAAAFIVEEPITWPLGVMHPDIHVVETDAIVEVLSSAHASEAMVRSKLLQLVGQIEHLDAKGGAVVVVNPSNPLDYELFPIARTSATYGGLVDEMRARIAQVQTWSVEGRLPDRVCSKPSESRGHFCLHAEHCFQGWEPPPPDAVLSSEEAIEAAVTVYRAKQVERAHKEAYDAAVTARKEAEQPLAEIVELAQLGGAAKKIRVGAVEVNRIVVSDHQELSLKKARDAGLWTLVHDDLFASFLEMKGGHVRFAVDRVGDQPLETYGDQAPWTAADLDVRS